MIVLDASALIELLLGTARGRRVGAHIADPAIGLHSPHLVDIEVAQVLRRLVRVGEIDDRTAKAAIHSLLDLDIERHSHDALLSRIWLLRGTLTAHDAAYVALAESLGAQLVTCDSRLARSPQLRGMRIVVP